MKYNNIKKDNFIEMTKQHCLSKEVQIQLLMNILLEDCEISKTILEIHNELLSESEAGSE
jgi:hypothetical protein